MGNINLGPLFVCAIVGIVAIFVMLGALCGAVLSLGFAVWHHDFTIMTMPTLIGAVIGGVGIVLFGLASVLRR